MQWLNIKTAFLRSSVFLDAPPAEQLAWLKVNAYCHDQENGGRVAGAALWDDRKWIRTADVTRDEVHSCKNLLTIEGNDVLVTEYPAEKQSEVEARRKGGAKGGRKRARNQREQQKLEAQLEAQLGTEPVDELQRKRIEEKRRESPKAPTGGLSEGELKFVSLVAEMQKTGAVSEGFTTRTAADLWHGHAIPARPDDPAVIRHLVAEASAMSGKIGSPGDWMRKRVEKLNAAPKEATKKMIDGLLNDAGPGAGEM